MIIKVDCKKTPELCRFAEMYVYPTGIVNINEYHLKLSRFSNDLVKLLYYGCEYVFEEEKCPVDVDKIYEEIINTFQEDIKFVNLVERLDISEFSDEPRDDHIILDNKVKIYPILKLYPHEYEIEYKIIFEVEY